MIEPSDAEDRIWQRAQHAFDEEDAALGTDSKATERVLARLLADPPRVVRPRRFRPVVLLAAAALLVVSIAGAVVGVLRSRDAAAPSSASSASSASSVPSSTHVIAPPLEPVEPVAPSEAPSANSPASEAPPASEPQQSAAELLSAAGQARRQGQNGRAMRLLERLQTRYPSSPEAQASDITLGMLRLQGGSPGVALSAFDRYLLRSPSGARAPDALWGRAQALSALGRKDEAKKSLELLLGRYPKSPYTSAAQAKLRGDAP